MRFDEKNYYAVSLTSFSAIYSQPKIFVDFCEINWLWKLVTIRWLFLKRPSWYFMNRGSTGLISQLTSLRTKILFKRTSEGVQHQVNLYQESALSTTLKLEKMRKMIQIMKSLWLFIWGYQNSYQEVSFMLINVMTSSLYLLFCCFSISLFLSCVYIVRISFSVVLAVGDCWSKLINPLHFTISLHICQTVLYTFPKVLTRRICLTIKGFLS